MKTDLASYRADRQRLVDELIAVGAIFKGSNCACPFCDDMNPSGGVYERENIWRYKCHKCDFQGDVFDVIARKQNITPAQAIRQAIGTGSKPLLPIAFTKPVIKSKAKKELVETYSYHDELGQLLYEVVRYEPKTFRQRRPDGKGGWIWDMKGVQRVLYCLANIIQTGEDSFIFIVEGEKDVDRLIFEGLVATTNPQGAGKWKQVDDTPLYGRHIVIIPDHDEKGQRHARQVAASLNKKTVSVRILNLPGLFDKGDVSDWLDAGGDTDGLIRLAENIPKWDKEKQSNADTALQTLEQDQFKPFPAEVLPQPLRDYVVEGAKSLGCDMSYIVLPLLSALASAIGNTRSIMLNGDWCEPCIVWAAIVGESGTLKSPAHDLALASIHTHQAAALKQHTDLMQLYEGEIAEYERQMGHWRRSKTGEQPSKPCQPIAQRFVVSDITIEGLALLLGDAPRGLLLARDELNGWLKGFDQYKSGGGADAAAWLEMHRAGKLLVDRKSSTTKMIHVPRASVSVCGGIQPGTLRRTISGEHTENGLLARLLLACPPRKAKRWTEDSIKQRTKEAISRLFERLYAFEPNFDENNSPCPIKLPLTKAGKSAWIDFYNEHAQEMADLSGALAACASKLEGYAARLALIVHCVRWAADDSTLISPDAVDEISIAAGVAMVTWFKGEAKRAYALMDETNDQCQTRELIQWIERKGGSVSVRDLTHGLWRYRSQSESARASLDELAKAGRGHWTIPESNQKGGRSPLRFELTRPITITKTISDRPENRGFGDGDVGQVNIEECEDTAA